MERNSLYNVSQSLLGLYAQADGSSLRNSLSRSLQEKYSLEDIQALLKTCKAMTGEIKRFSLPTSGTRTYAFFAVYAEKGTFDMILEIGLDEKIVYWVVSQDVTEREQACSFANFPQPKTK